MPSEPVADIVGREAETFDLTLTAEGTVIAADPAPLEAIGAARITAAVPEGKQLREGSVRVEVGPGVVEGETIRYPVAARAEAVRDITSDEVRELVRGKTPAEAREILADYGSVEIVVWPDWVSTITTIDGRLVISVEGLPPAEPTAAPSPTPAAGDPCTIPEPERVAALVGGPVTRLLGVDLGTRRVGLAVAEAGEERARPLATLARRRTTAADAEALARIAAANGIDEVIVGLPLDMSGAEGAMAAAARQWATAVAQQTGLVVRLRDERLSSHVAESRVGAPGRGRAGGPPGPVRRAAHRARIDREAAAVILEDELRARLREAPGERVGVPPDDGTQQEDA